MKSLPPEKSAPVVQFQGPFVGEGNFRALQETIKVILKEAELERASTDSRASSLPTSLMFLIMDPFFKHYIPQLAHNCCPCHMNYASCNANPGSLALDKSQAVEEAGVITKTIPEDLEKMSIIWSTGRPALPSPRAVQTHPYSLGFNEQLLGFEQVLCAKQCANIYHASTSLFLTILGGWDYHFIHYTP